MPPQIMSVDNSAKPCTSPVKCPQQTAHENCCAKAYCKKGPTRTGRSPGLTSRVCGGDETPHNLPMPEGTAAPLPFLLRIAQPKVTAQQRLGFQPDSPITLPTHSGKLKVTTVRFHHPTTTPWVPFTFLPDCQSTPTPLAVTDSL